MLPCIRRIDGGTVGNAVPGKAEAVVEGISTDEIARDASAIEEQTGIAFRWEEKMGALRSVRKARVLMPPRLGKETVHLLACWR